MQWKRVYTYPTTCEANILLPNAIHIASHALQQSHFTTGSDCDNTQPNPVTQEELSQPIKQHVWRFSQREVSLNLVPQPQQRTFSRVPSCKLFY